MLGFVNSRGPPVFQRVDIQLKQTRNSNFSQIFPQEFLFLTSENPKWRRVGNLKELHEHLIISMFCKKF